MLDTNVLISAFAARGLCADLFRDVLAHHTLMLSDYILDELREKLAGKLRVPLPIVESIHTLLVPYRCQVDKLPDLAVNIRDPEDIAVVAFTLSIGTDLLITGDRDLLDIADELPVRVISPRQFYDAT
ncbi:MAG: putative toxin-antitoxin system toxin component, PIN family [Blastochloris sp.]|nr:putative toxin-antitoxin system toxin component, PIN family [Blastochloris sp.]